MLDSGKTIPNETRSRSCGSDPSRRGFQTGVLGNPSGFTLTVEYADSGHLAEASALEAESHNDEATHPVQA